MGLAACGSLTGALRRPASPSPSSSRLCTWLGHGRQWGGGLVHCPCDPCLLSCLAGMGALPIGAHVDPPHDSGTDWGGVKEAGRCFRGWVAAPGRVVFSPTARVGPSVPRQDRPVREGTRVASIETGLAAAAAKLSQQVRRGPAWAQAPQMPLLLPALWPACPGWELSQGWGRLSTAEPWQCAAGEVGAGSGSPGSSESVGGGMRGGEGAEDTSPRAGGMLVCTQAPALL